MTRWPHYLTVAIGVGSIAAVLSLTAARPAIAQRGGAAPVTIAGPLPLPVQAAGTPFQAKLCRVIGSVTCNDLTTHTLTVSSDVRLVIEFVSASCVAFGTDSPHVGRIRLSTTVATNEGFHHIIPVPTAVSTEAMETVSSQSTKIYADPGTDVVLSFFGGGIANGRCDVSISGYTIAA